MIHVSQVCYEKTGAPRRSSRIVYVAAVAAASDLARVRSTAGGCLARNELVEAAGRDINSAGGGRMLSRKIHGTSDMAKGKQRPRRPQDSHSVEQRSKGTTEGWTRTKRRGNGGEHKDSLFPPFQCERRLGGQSSVGRMFSHSSD